MASSLLLLLRPLPILSPLPTPSILRNALHVPFLPKLYSARKRTSLFQRFTVPFAVAESDSPQSLDPNPQDLLQELADSFDLPPGYLGQLPRDLRLDLNDAAFDLSNGPVIDECGQELGEVLLNLSRAWEQADTSASLALARKLPLLGCTLPESAKSAFGKRLLSAGMRFQSMGQYGQGELQRIAQALTTAGKLLSARSVSTAETDTQLTTETRILKFGELQVEVTPENANIGAVIGLVFGVLSWQLSQGIQSMPESSMQYANDNALMLAKSLRGFFILLFYSSTVLSGVSSLGLLLLGWQLRSKAK